MSDARIIEIEGETAGIAVTDAGGVNFYAAHRKFYPLDGLHFRTCKDAERAAVELLSKRRAPLDPLALC